MDIEDRDPSDETPARDSTLGHIAPGERDSQLDAPEQPKPASHRRRYGAPADAPEQPSPGPPPLDEQASAPVLPRGGLIVMRVSGGFKFSSREIVIYRDGRVVYRRHADGMSVYQGGPQRLSEGQLAELQRLIEQLQVPRFAGPGARQSPDTIAYEIAARAGRRLKTVEAFTGSIPETLAPLISWLAVLMPRDE